MLISAIGFPATHVKHWSTLMSTASDLRDLFGVLLRSRTGVCRVGDCSTWSLWMVARRKSCGGILAEFLSIHCLLGEGVVTASLRNFYQFTVCWEKLWRRPCGISINLLFAGRSCGGVLAEFLSIAFSLGEGIVAASLRNFYHLPFR